MQHQSSAVERHEPREDAPHACYDGWVYIGYIVEDEHGEEVEVTDRVPCRRCRG